MQQVSEVQAADNGTGWDVVFLGDSLMECWRGTFMGMRWGGFQAVPQLWEQHFGKYAAASLGIAGAPPVM